MQKTIQLFWPLLLLPLLFIPYSILNAEVIVNWLGCGCPRINEAGNVIENSFNANDFTALFWCGVSVLIVALSAVQSKKLEKRRFKLLYLFTVIVICFFVSSFFSQVMKWR
jgi:hypothetical protein